MFGELDKEFVKAFKYLFLFSLCETSFKGKIMMKPHSKTDNISDV